jgi:hypothetical protein
MIGGWVSHERLGKVLGIGVYLAVLGVVGRLIIGSF